MRAMTLSNRLRAMSSHHPLEPSQEFGAGRYLRHTGNPPLAPLASGPVFGTRASPGGGDPDPKINSQAVARPVPGTPFAPGRGPEPERRSVLHGDRKMPNDPQAREKTRALTLSVIIEDGFHSPGALISMLFLCCGGIELAPPLPTRI